MPSVVIAGGGLVGAVNACFFGQMGWKVTVYESRPDPRGRCLEHGKSINLALGCRAIGALELIGLKERVIEIGVPIREKLRYQGEKEGVFEKVQTLNEGDYILSINRHRLNQLLVNEAVKYNNVKFLFNCKATKFDINSETLLVETPDGLVTVDGDLILACDGAHSSIRRSLLKHDRFNFSQKYCDIGYIDLSVKIQDTCELKLGIHNSWRTDGVILVALVNRDQTLTVSMFANFSVFEKYFSTPEDSVEFFKTRIPVVYGIMGEKHILDTFSKNKPQAIISVQCSQHSFFDKLILMGDAAHAMLPFQGQGANCGFEDCVVLQEILEDIEDDMLGNAVKEYSRVRTNDTNIMNQMEWDAYVQLNHELGNHKTQWMHTVKTLLKKKLDLFFPSTFALSTFSRTPYSEISKKRQIALKGEQLLTIVPISALFSIFVFYFLTNYP